MLNSELKNKWILFHGTSCAWGGNNFKSFSFGLALSNIDCIYRDTEVESLYRLRPKKTDQ
ncbi:hypothetical protein DRQ07_02770 [candidate division KSB1 bacterium]|nr:MAG: hypothetical protein DRQ07_02770 [candidate division KSB1 bacterium]